MLKRDRQIRMQIHQLMDVCLVAVSFWLAFELRADVFVTELFRLERVALPFQDYMWMYLLIIPAAPLVLEAQGFYTRPLIPSRRTTVWMLLKACVVLSLGLILVLFFARTVVPRWIVIWFGCISFGLILIKEELLRLAAKGRAAMEPYQRRFILAGTPAENSRVRRDLERNSQDEIRVVLELDLETLKIEHLIQMLHEHSANGVILSAKRANFPQVESAIRVCEVEGVEVWLLAEFFGTQISRPSFDDLYGRPILVFRSAPAASWQGVLKQLLDFLLALIMLSILAVPLALVALIVKLTSPGPVFFRQQRSGLNGRPFTLYKFRTMVTNAEQLKHELEAMNEMTGPVFKVTNDPRITPIGRLLRKFSIDEFPQLYNVLRGEMSLVGPRPLPVDETKRFNDLAHRRRLSVKPGLTCLWQISGRNDVKDFRDWVRLDLEYIDNWSFWLDVKILWRTVPIVLTGAGAK
jgi:exopolysaccharide biosynthesis polyprenyl glycosylphosphotransferase